MNLAAVKRQRMAGSCYYFRRSKLLGSRPTSFCITTLFKRGVD